MSATRCQRVLSEAVRTCSSSAQRLGVVLNRVLGPAEKRGDSRSDQESSRLWARRGSSATVQLVVAKERDVTAPVGVAYVE